MYILKTYAVPQRSGKSRREGNRINGYRSGFEAKLAKELGLRNIKYKYEPFIMEYFHEIPGLCNECGSSNISRVRRYLPDFFVPSRPKSEREGWILEAKGRFTSSDRTKMLRVRESWHKDYQLHMVFMRNNYLTSRKVNTYGEWCDRNEISWSVGIDKALAFNLKRMQNGK